MPDITTQLFRVDDRTVVKGCDPKRLAEAEALKLVRFKTSLAVLEVYSAYVDETINRGFSVVEDVGRRCPSRCDQ